MQKTEEAKKREAWNFALGLTKGAGLTPTEDFLEMVEKEVAGEVTTEEMREYLIKKYSNKGEINEH